VTTSGEEEPGRVEREASEWLARLRGGSRQDQQAFEDWYCANPEHADAYDRVLANWETMERLARPSARPARSRYHWIYGIAAVAAVLVLSVGLGTHHIPKPAAGAADVAMSTRVGEIRTVALPDGSHVTLDTQSAIRTDFGTAHRHVRLVRGRAHFDVANESRPFVIETGTTSVSADGAIVDVSFIDDRTDVGVIRGTANLRPLLHDTALVRLDAGTTLRSGRDGPLGPSHAYPPAATRWTTGMLSFENADLASVVAIANRYNYTRIVLAGPSLGDLKFTGTVKARDPAGITHMMAAMFGLHLDTTDPTRLVLSR